MTEMTIQDQILDFNNDFQVQSLRAKYNRPTFFELMAKGRSETVHSSFLSWLLLGDDLNQQSINLPIISFLGILVRRDAQQNKLIPTSLKKSIITRSIKIDSVKTSCEFPVKKLAIKKYNLTEPKDEDILKIATKSQDKIDLLIDCNIQEVGGYKKLQIILENKVSAIEGSSKKDSKTGCDKYDSSDQTSRYFMGTKCKDDETYQFFVYLTPLSSQNLDDYSNLSATQKCGKSDEYIQINYQDIADRVVTPLLWSDNLSDRASMLLEEYMETLTIPALTSSDEEDANDVKKMLVMASKAEDRNQLLDFLNKYQDLILNSVLIANPSIEINTYGNCERIIRTHIEKLPEDIKKAILCGEIDKVDKNIVIKSQEIEFEDFCDSKPMLYASLKQNPTQEELVSIVKKATKQWENAADELTQNKLNDIFGRGVVRIGGKKNRLIKYSYRDENAKQKTARFQVAKIEGTGSVNKISLRPIITWEEFFQHEAVYDLALLYDFYKQNSRLIVAAMKILVESSNNSADLTLWQDLYEGLTTNVDRTKYLVTIAASLSNKPLNKREVVKYIVQNIELDDNLIGELNKAIPRMFLKFEDGENQEFDRSRYEGLEKDEDTDFYVCRSLRDDKLYSLYVSNQWGVLPLSDDEKKDKVNHPSGEGGNFGKLLDFFLKNKDYKVKIKEEKAKED